PIRSIESALHLLAARSSRDAFGPADGLLMSDAVRNRLARRFGPQHLWSPSQWEQYAHCPFQFFVQQLLQLEPLGDLTLETDHLRRGSRLHRVLAGVHRQLRDRSASTSFSRHDADAVAAAFEQAVAAEFGHSPRSGLDGALDELDRRQLA